MALLNIAYRKLNREIDETGAWLSIGDLMSALLMLFALLLIVTLLQLTREAEKTQNSRIVIIRTLENQLKAEGITAEVDQKTGDISILDSVLFDRNSAALKPEGIKFLGRFIPLYAEVLLANDEIASQITLLIVEGHTSISGSWKHNMNLSVERSASVFSQIDKMEFPFKQKMIKKLLVAGRGPAAANADVDTYSDRKVVFRIQFVGDKFYEQFLSRKSITVQ